MKVSVELTYSHGYFVRFPHSGADIIAYLLEFPNIKAINLVCLCHSVMITNYCKVIKLVLATFVYIVSKEFWRQIKGGELYRCMK